MSDHNFEKQIQQKLGELKVSPAESVWTTLEARIRKEKRRRRGLILLPLLLMLVGGGLYFMIETKTFSTGDGNTKTATLQPGTKDISSKDNTPGANDKNSTSPDLQSNQLTIPGTADATTSTQPNKNAKGSSVPEGIEKSNIREEQSQSNKTRSPEKIDNAAGKDVQTITYNRNPNRSLQKETEINKKNQRVSTQDKRDQINSNPDETSVDLATKQRNEPPVNTAEKPATSQPPPGVPDSVAISQNRDVAIVKEDSALNQIKTSIESLDSASSQASSTNAASLKKGKRSDFTWGITTSLGGSNIVDGGIFHGVFGGILGTEKSLMADVASSPLNSSGGTPQAIIYKPSAIRKGFSFSAGAFIQKNLSKRFSVSTGLQYHYYSTGIKVGRQVDSITMVQNAFGLQSVNNFYRAAPIATTHEYSNKFHFAELPLAINFRLIRSSRLPVFANAGISMSYLLSTNALHFDSRTGVYYEDDGFFNRLQANLSGGFSIGVWNSSKLPIQIGPEFRYGLTNLMKEEVSASKRLVYVGLNTRFFLKK